MRPTWRWLSLPLIILFVSLSCSLTSQARPSTPAPIDEVVPTPTETVGVAAVEPEVQTPEAQATPEGELPAEEPAQEAPASVTSIPDPSSYGWNFVAGNYSKPVDLQHAGDNSGRVFVVEQSGIISILGENSNQINNRFFCLTHRQSYGRLADLLLCLAGRVFKADKFELDLTRKELAELAGMSTENVIRILKKFQEDELIELKGKLITLKDLDALQRICDLG